VGALLFHLLFVVVEVVESLVLAAVVREVVDGIVVEEFDVVEVMVVV